MASDREFREIVYHQIEERANGDDNVLIETLSKIEASNRQTFGARMNDLVNVEGGIEGTLNKFRGIEGHDLHPQIYIPFYDKVMERRRANSQSKTSFLQEEPVVVLFDGVDPGDDSEVIYTGYHLNESGELTESNLEVDEEYALNNEVWVISINENVTDEDLESANVLVSYPNVRFNKIKISSHKESWIAGASEVHIKRYLSFYAYALHSTSPTAAAYSSEDAVDDSDGWRIKKVHRADVGKWLTFNWVYAQNWPVRMKDFGNGSIIHTDYFYYVVFEYDAWPTKMRSAYIPDAANSAEFYTQYRSADVYYKIGFIPENSANGWSSSSGFHFTSQY